MCGIVGYIGNRPCSQLLIDGLRRLEYRGYDSAGIAVHDGTQVQRLRAEGKLSQLERRHLESPLKGSVGIAHTRWATHGKPVERNAHPHKVGAIVVVHNGIIENYRELRAELSAQGASFESETDTEIIAHLVARYREESPDLLSAVQKSIARVEGSYGLVVMDEREPSELIAAREASPLVIGLGEGENFAASDVPAIMQHTRQVVFLEDGDVARLTQDSVSFFDGDGSNVERSPVRIQWDPVSAEKQGYKHFMLKEIHEQPTCVVDTLRGRLSPESGQVSLPELDALPAELFSGLERIIIVACGTSWHSGLVGKYAIESLARVPVEVDLASEFRYRNPIVGERTLVIAISQSGETADTLAALKEAKRLGAKVISVCNVMESSIPRASLATLYTQAGPEIGVASTKAFTTQLCVLYLFAIWLGRRLGAIDSKLERTLVEGLRAIPGQMETILKREAEIREIAKAYKGARGFLFLGRSVQFPIALEGALKLKEISYIHAEGYAAGEMKHGPIALIDAELPVVVLAPANNHFEKTASNLEEVSARGGRIIVVTSEGKEDLKEFAEECLTIPHPTHELLQPLLTILPLQLLSYGVADALGTDIDQPRNLAKSVTVE